MRPKLRKARRPILRLNLNQNRLTDRLPTVLIENFEIFSCRLNVGELTNLTDMVG
jgi:hypothetical protein